MENKFGFDPSIMLDYSFDDGLFSILYDVKRRLSESTILKVLELIDRCYPNSSFKEDWFIEAKTEISLKDYINYYFVHRLGLINDIIINIPVFIQSTEGQLFETSTKIAGIEFICDESEESPIYGVTIYPYVYFDKTTLSRNGEIIYQEDAAKMNRQVLHDFLKSLEEILQAQPKDISCAHPHFEDYIYKYGVKDGAKYLL